VSSVGLPTQTFRSALEFLDAFDPARPGCLVLDVRMARMSGIALQAKLKEKGARIPIVFISGHGDIGMAVNAIKDGAVDFVQKPYHEQQLLDAIDEALRRDAAQRAPPADAGGLTERVATLTAREREVMALALKGLPSIIAGSSPSATARSSSTAAGCREARRRLGHRAIRLTDRRSNNSGRSPHGPLRPLARGAVGPGTSRRRAAEIRKKGGAIKRRGRA
jgi:FixJ family two-component response regulator